MRDKITRTLSGLKKPPVPRLQTWVRFLCSYRGQQYGGRQLGGVRRRPPLEVQRGARSPQAGERGRAAGGLRSSVAGGCSHVRPYEMCRAGPGAGSTAAEGRTPTRKTAPGPASRGLRRLPHRRANRAASAPPRPAPARPEPRGSRAHDAYLGGVSS